MPFSVNHIIVTFDKLLMNLMESSLKKGIPTPFSIYFLPKLSSQMKTYGYPYEVKIPKNSPNVLILGMGNLRRSDLGIGIHIINELEKRNLPRNISLLKGNYNEIDFNKQINGFKKLILIDAANDTFDPGTIFIHRPDFTLDFSSLTFSRISKKDKTSYLLKKSNSVFLFTITPMDIDSHSNQLSFPLKKVMPRVIDEVTNLAHKLVDA